MLFQGEGAECGLPRVIWSEVRKFQTVRFRAIAVIWRAQFSQDLSEQAWTRILAYRAAEHPVEPFTHKAVDRVRFLQSSTSRT
jgi:hypothetical protein